jgi:hypothetical protein
LNLKVIKPKGVSMKVQKIKDWEHGKLCVLHPSEIPKVEDIEEETTDESPLSVGDSVIQLLQRWEEDEAEPIGWDSLVTKTLRDTNRPLAA